ncbi:DAK2 domain-containing protein [Lachnoclostridium edouardi]|uniref:DAK2 domain-containing protein n=1 Tax=Lachnoclostridium edouardi TaxID=1926283 RepID=UPI000C7AFFE9|nr:DAK2 domain-containing protein [Lachnoclostridium edouardi]MDO4277643.1 DAK2 domain-containing protein [Lachnoclostridium edouardi]
MGMNSIDAKGVQKAFLAAAKGLEANKEWINQLNVFPVPDGDTGTNMSMTIMAAAREVAAVEKPDMETVAKAISSGSLRGARGNSGVILSQLFRGFTKEIKTSDQITTEILANSFVRATETAYKAVMKPKEGTILTVARGMADKAVELAPQIQDIVEFADQVIAHGDYVLSQTPEMLPVLKQAGVVDSGGQGLMQVLKGARDGLLGKEPDIQIEAAKTVVTSPTPQDREQEAIQFGYCTEFIINLEKEYSEKTEDELKSYLESIGDSIVVVSDDDIVKVHVHTNHPGLAFEKALTYGSLSRMKVDNMREEHEEKLLKEMELEKQQPRKKSGFIAVSIGDGLGEIFKGIGADYLIEGGQTMNPSTEDMLKAIEQVNADTVFIFPNNKNIILAAEQAKSLVEDKNIVVIPSKTIPQGITALINYLPELSPEENEENMTREMGNVKTGQITYAVRSTVIDGIQIEEGDIMGIGDNGILTSDQSVETAAVNTLKALTDDSSELITIYYGCDVSEEEADRVLSLAEKTCPQCEIELHSGGQPVYYYLISVE